MSSIDIFLQRLSLVRYSTYLTNLSNYACKIRAINENLSEKYREESSHKIIKKNQKLKYININRCSMLSTKALCKYMNYQKVSHDEFYGKMRQKQVIPDAKK